MNNFLLGFGVGLAVGLLMAPRSGAENREYLSSKANEGSDYLVQQGQQLKDSAADLLERGKNAVLDQKDKLTGAAQDVGQQAYQR